jgi:predicted adenylyl cyclase CyaB
MTEIEAKVIDIDRCAVEARLGALGAERQFDGEMLALLFDYPDRRLGRDGHLLRLRREGDRCRLTFKRRLTEQGAKVRDESEVTIGDFEIGRRILAAIGLVESARVEKHRTAFRLGAATIAFDRHSGEHSFIPEFMEIEAPSVEAVRSAAAQLGFGVEALLPWGLPQLIEHYQRG